MSNRAISMNYVAPERAPSFVRYSTRQWYFRHFTATMNPWMGTKQSCSSYCTTRQRSSKMSAHGWKSNDPETQLLTQISRFSVGVIAAPALLFFDALFQWDMST